MKTVTVVERPAPSPSQQLISNSHPLTNVTSGRSIESVSDKAPMTADAVEWAEARRMSNAIPGRRDALLPFLPVGVASVSAVTCTLKEILRSRARRVAAGPGGLLSLARAVTVSLSRVGPLRRRCGASRPLSVRPVCVQVPLCNYLCR